MRLLKGFSSMVRTAAVVMVILFFFNMYNTSSFDSKSLRSEFDAVKEGLAGYTEMVSNLPGQLQVMWQDINQLPDNMQKIRDNIEDIKNAK